METPVVLTAEEAAIFLKTGVDSLRRKARAGQIKATKDGHWKFFMHDLIAHLELKSNRANSKVVIRNNANRLVLVDNNTTLDLALTFAK